MEFLDRALKKYSSVKISLFLGDFIVLFISVMITLSMGYKQRLFFRNPFANWEQVTAYLFVIYLVVTFFRFSDLYKLKTYLSYFEQFFKILKSVLFSSLFLIFLVFFLKDPKLENNARFHYTVFFTTAVVFVYLYRVIFVKLMYSKGELKDVFRRRILAVGAGELGAQFASKLEKIRINYYELVGFIDDDESKKDAKVNNLPILGRTSDLDEIIHRYGIDEIFITIESISYEDLMDLIAVCKRNGNQVNVISSHYSVVNRKFEGPEFEGYRFISINSSVMPLYNEVIKGVFDKLFTFFVLIALIPFFAIIGLLIKLTSKGPVFYKTKVIGKNGVPFVWYKFRTMRAGDSQEPHKKHLEEIIKHNKSVEKLKDDPRITGIGKILRKFSLDELPQLFSVLKGDMSIIGPRPCLPYEYELMEVWQRRRTVVTPGITGLWQIAGRNKKDVTFNDSIVLDLYYAENQSFWLDLKIFIKTFPVVLLGRGGV